MSPSTQLRCRATLYDAIADGLRTAGLLQKLQALEDEKAELERKLEAPAPSAVRFHPKLAELYRSKVSELSEALKDETIRAPALDLLRSLIDRVVVHHDAGTKGITLELEGALSAMIAQAQPGGLGDVDPSSLELVAGARIALWRKPRCLFPSPGERRVTRGRIATPPAWPIGIRWSTRSLARHRSA
ncbi:hypothetical protein [Salipiger bermudensis]|uniref:Uncharacterized protein n=1 Tax=Salipiger bermudensis (strain DSM 26914 / JCM 13377 / KCTC 12554 / HTCC2601) TaxID=314265 RepID=Q0FKM0_SALBH|nr:hypothetical protein [Salipiger bermudensis]EAU44712.1 hypothetical protein R2601_07598 [Salipiger bermudensis HTCC2601]